MTLADLVSFVKRKGRYGDVGNTSDQATTDIILALNARMFRFWRKWNWDWSREAISITIVSGTSEYTLSSTIGDIVILESGNDDFLRPLSLKRYLQWVKRDGEVNGDITHYIKLGRDSSGNFKLKFWRTPDTSGTVTGYGKKRLTRYTVSDIASNTSIQFFPEETLDILIEGVLSDVAMIQGEKDAAIVLNSSFEEKIKDLIPEETNDEDEEPTSPPPDNFIWKKRNRGGTNVV